MLAVTIKCFIPTIKHSISSLFYSYQSLTLEPLKACMTCVSELAMLWEKADVDDHCAESCCRLYRRGPTPATVGGGSSGAGPFRLLCD